MATIYDFIIKTLDGKETTLTHYAGRPLLIVNTATGCGFTPQLKGLEKTYNKFQEQGLEVLAFPCNQFGNQEPLDGDKIKEFCELNYKTSFPIFAKVDVNGPNANPLFPFLTKKLPGILGTKAIKWNFTKFLISKEGTPIKRYAPNVTPEKIEEDLKQLLSH